LVCTCDRNNQTWTNQEGAPLDKNEYGFRIFLSRGVGGLRGISVAEKREYYDDWWNGKKSGNQIST
jgi:hypothetical protein